MSKCQANSTQELKYSTARLNDRITRLEDSTARLKDSTGRLKDSMARLKDSTARLKDSTARLKDSTARLKDSTARLKDSTARMRGEQAQMREQIRDIDMAILGVGLFSFFFELLFLTCNYWVLSLCCRTEMRSARSPVAYSSIGLETNWLSCVGILTGKLGRSVAWQWEMSLLLEMQLECSQRRR